MVMITYTGKKGVYRIGKTSPYAIYANCTYVEVLDIRGCKKNTSYVDNLKAALELIAEAENITYDHLITILELRDL